MSERNSAASILLVLNDYSTLAVISYHLERYGFIVNSARNTESIITSVERIEPSILILDEETPGELRPSDICAILKTKNKTKNIHIIYASKIEQKNNVFINDSILKPFVPSELVNKIKAFFAKTTISNNKKIINYHDIEMNIGSFRVSRLGKQIHLGPTEFKILQCFLELPGRILSREHIMNHVWGYNSQVEPRTIDVHINRLRTALKENDDELPLIRTIRSAGYSLSAPNVAVKV